MSIRSAVLFPGALGDFICFLPTLLALRARHPGRMLLAAAPALIDLVRVDELSTLSIHGREISGLFAPAAAAAPRMEGWLSEGAHVYSWTGFHDSDFRRHLEAAVGRGAGIYPFRGMHPGEHAADYYARCVGLQPHAIPPGIIRVDDDWFSEFSRRQRLWQRPFLVIHAGSGAPRKNWRGFEALARDWQRERDDAVVVLRGPAERGPAARGPAARGKGAVERWADGSIVADDLSLPQVASLLQHSASYVGNDSGISHLAAAVGARGVAVFGPSDPVSWAPRSATLRPLHAPQPCARCGPEVFCVHRLPTDVVAGAVAEALRG